MQRQRTYSRRSFGKMSFIVLSGSLTAACSTPGLPKIAKANARYQDRPNGKQHCANCVHFTQPDRCTIVDGEISPNGWSTYFMAKIG